MADGDNQTRNGNADARLASFVQRIERLEEEKAALAADVREVYAELKGAGFDTKVVRKLIAERKQDAAERQEQESLLDLYRYSIRGIADLPLGHAALARAKGNTKELRKAADKLKRAGATVEVAGVTV